MCMCGFMAAEHNDLPDAVRIEVEGFGNANIKWLAEMLAALDPNADPAALHRQATAIFAAVGGAQLAARSRNDIATYDDVIAAYRATGLIPDRR
jgi:TetR/AcrR family transcriptional repressor of nem operon